MTTKPPSPTASGPDEPEFDDDERLGRSRTSLKKERVNNELALTELSLRLIELNLAQLQTLGLSELAVEAIETTRHIKTFSAQNRHLRLVRARLRDLDWMQIRATLDQRRAGFVTSSIPTFSEEARVWAEQLLVQKDEGLMRFVREFENANRQRLRQLVRNVNQSGEAKRHKARLLLLSAVEETLRVAAQRRDAQLTGKTS